MVVKQSSIESGFTLHERTTLALRASSMHELEDSNFPNRMFVLLQPL